MPRLLVALFSIVFLSSARAICEDNFAAEVFGSVDNLTVVKTAHQVSACILTPKSKFATPEYLDNLPNPDTYQEGTRVEVPEKQLADIRSILLDSKIREHFKTACIPVYHVRLTFTAGEKSVELNICFQCDILTTRRDLKTVGATDIDLVHTKLLQICQQLFPQDTGLKEAEASRKPK